MKFKIIMTPARVFLLKTIGVALVLAWLLKDGDLAIIMRLIALLSAFAFVLNIIYIRAKDE